MQWATFNLRVGGEYACFSRPELKVERVSYLAITPSAARGLCEAIYWKPEIRWEIREIWLLKPIQQTVILRNELSDWQGDAPFLVEERRQQRASLILKDVEYLIRAEIVQRPHAQSPLTKYAEQFARRLERGQCHHTPYLGTREFAAWFEPASGREVPQAIDMRLGQTLFDIAYREDSAQAEMRFHRHGINGARVARGFAQALFFQAELKAGVISVPPEKYLDLYRLEGQGA